AVGSEPDSVRIWSKYIVTLIESYDWKAAQKALARLKVLPVSNSYVHKLTGDFYARQGRMVEALAWYRKSLAQERIDTSAYAAYAQCLLELKRFDDAAFYFSMARRFDPLDINSIVGTAKSISGSESIDRGIQMLRDQMQL